MIFRVADRHQRREGYVSFFVEGDYFEVCNCDVSCNCIWLGAATNDNCDVWPAWHVTKDGVDLSGLNAVMAVHSPKRMTDGGWKVALYLDDCASAEQSEALGAVFSGGAGGYLAGLGPLIGEVAGGSRRRSRSRSQTARRTPRSRVLCR